MSMEANNRGFAFPSPCKIRSAALLPHISLLWLIKGQNPLNSDFSVFCFMAKVNMNREGRLQSQYDCYHDLVALIFLFLLSLVCTVNMKLLPAAD